MDGSRGRLAIALIAVLALACDSKAVSTVAPPNEPSAAAPSGTPRIHPTATPIVTVAPSLAPTSIDLPSGFDAIAWAHMPFSADANTFVVSYGVLGKPATGSKTYSAQPSVAASSHAVIIEPIDEPLTEIIDARTGATIAMFERDALRLSLDGIDSNDERYSYVQKLLADVDHGFLYDMSANRSGLQLRRFDLHGEHPTLLATLAPDPGKDFWVEVDFVVADDGTVVATSCPPDGSKVSDHRCRLYVVPVGAAGPIKPRLLPANGPRPCFLVAADAQFAIGGPDPGCRADGGADQFISYMALDLATLRSVVTLAPSDLAGGGIEYLGNDVGPLPALVANLYPRLTYGSPYPAIAVRLGFGDSRFTIQRYVEVGEDPDGATAAYPDYVWAIRGRGLGWTLLHGYGPEFARCAAGASFESPPSCESGPEVLVTESGTFELPPNTWGEFVAPYSLGSGI